MADGSTSSHGNVVVLPLQAWGHLRPLIALVARIAQASPLSITFFTPKHLYNKIEVELSRHFDPAQSSRRACIRLVALPGDKNNALDLSTFFTAFIKVYRQMLKGEPLICAHSGKITKTLHLPNAIILDMFAHSVTVQVRRLSRQKIQIFCYTPCSAFATHRIVHTALEINEHRSLDNLRQNLQRKANRCGKSLEDIAREEFMSTSGKIVKSPGLPPMYDYESYPQEVPPTRLSPLYHIDMIEHMIECDGIITSGPACFEPPEGLSALTAWLAETSRSLYAVGPLSPLDNYEHAVMQEKTMSKDSQAIDNFMERTLKENGERSMIFMSFGSLFWPINSSKVWAFIGVLLKRRIPFIFSLGAQLVSIPDDVLASVSGSKMGLLTSWAPQQTILAHPVTGWFVTHAGFNSVMESVIAGVPMICWPFRAEQPANTQHITQNLDIAYELFEVRTGPDISRAIFVLGCAPQDTLEALCVEACAVLDKAFGPDGERKRANVRRMRVEAMKAWKEDGESREAVRRLVHACMDFKCT